MKKFVLLSLMLGGLPLTMMAQVDDDMYFVPTKKAVEKQKANYTLPQDTYYVGSNRSIDDYNRRIPPVVVSVDTALCDTINFDGKMGVYPDSVQDYQLTREMSRWDGYEPKESYWDGYADGRHDAMVNWHSPWFYNDYYMWWDPWLMDRYYLYHGVWGSPWYWYDPIYMSYYNWYGYGSWYYPGYYAPYYPGYAVTTGTTGTQNHGTINYNGPRGISNGRSTTYSAGTFGGSRVGTVNRSTGSLGTRTNTSSTAGRTTTTAGRTTNAYGNFGGNRARTASSSGTSSSSYTPSTSSSGSYSSGGGFSGGSSSSSSGGGSFGGSRSTGGGGGGGFGGRR